MQLKRKRSTDLSTSTSPFSATTTSTSRQSHSPSPFRSGPPPPHQPAGVNSRTLKRYRDNRPSEDMIYQKTLQRLYAAQRQGHDVEPVMSAPLVDTTEAQEEATVGQKSLESFWRITSGRQGGQAQTGASALRESQGVRCEDCDTPMKEAQVDGEGDYDMMDSAPLEVIAHSGGGHCGGCRKVVCGLCSLVRDHRVCLECAGKGWT